MHEVTQVLQDGIELEVQTRYCETCKFPLAVEWRGEAGKAEEVIYFCVNREKRCPQYHLAQ